MLPDVEVEVVWKPFFLNQAMGAAPVCKHREQRLRELAVACYRNFYFTFLCSIRGVCTDTEHGSGVCALIQNTADTAGRCPRPLYIVCSAAKRQFYISKFGEAKFESMEPHMTKTMLGEGIAVTYDGLISGTLDSHRLQAWAAKQGNGGRLG